VGSAPVGVVLVDGGRLAVVADSDRFALETIRVADLISAANPRAKR
jgi:hypothetical protein